jgi:hypothetical protein
MNCSFALRVLLFLALATLCAPALSDDLFPPAWRGEPGTTVQQWLFSTNPPIPSGHVPADGLKNNPYGNPFYEVVGWHAYYGVYPDTWFGRSGILGVTASDPMYVTIPNTPADPDRHKDVLVQLTWQSSWGKKPTVTATNPAGVVTDGSTVVLDANWSHSTYSVYYPENPDSEVIKIGNSAGTIYLDQMVFDTRCVPEPSILAMLGIGAIGLLGYRWRRRRAVAR